MAGPKFLTEDEILQILKSELPDDLFAQDNANNPDPAKNSYSSSELRAAANAFANVYAGLQKRYNDKFITTATSSGLDDWANELFSSAQDSSLEVNQKRGNALAKLRASQGISYAGITALVSGVLDPLGIDFDVCTWSGLNNGAWVLDESPLDLGTYLSQIDPIEGMVAGNTALDCSGNYVAAGLTEEQYREIQQVAYTYEVRIYGTVDSVTLNLLDQLLTIAEGARSTHILQNNFPGSLSPDNNTYTGTGS